MPKPSLMLQSYLRMMEKIGFEEKQAQLLALGNLNLDISEIKEEIQSEQEMIAEEAANFVPLHQTLDDFRDEDTYNVKDESAAIYQKNPVYKNVKPRLGRMTIDKNTGERKIIHLDE
jgi:hypothetical protein